MKLIRSLLAVAAITALLAGCGGSTSSSSSAPLTSSPAKTEAETSGGATRAAYIKEADAVCQATDEATATLDEEIETLTKFGTPETPSGEAKLAELLVRIVFIGREEGQELTTIEPSPAGTATITRWFTTGQEGLSELEAAAIALEKRSSAKFDRLYSEGLATLEQADAIARGYGFKVCGAERQIIR